MKLGYLLIILSALGLSACTATQTNHPQTMPLKDTFRQSANVAGKIALPLDYQGHQYWLLTSERDGILLTDSAGAVLSRYSGIMELLDWRDNIHINGKAFGLIATVENESAMTLVLALDWQQKKLSLLTTLKASSAQIEALCWYQKPEGHLSLFSIDALGQIQQRMVVDANSQQLTDIAVREFIGTPEAKACAVDDQQGALYVVEANNGLWRYNANVEAELARELIIATQPIGVVDSEITHVSLLADGNLLVSAPEQQGFWHVDASLATAPQFYPLSGSQAPESVNALMLSSDNTQGSMLLGVFDDESGLYSAVEQSLHLSKQGKQFQANAMPTLLPVAQTKPVSRFGDAADDPAIWVNKHRPEDSRVLGTDKKQGLMLYDLNGALLQELNVGRVNNVDLRYGFEIDGEIVDIAAASNRTLGGISLFAINPQNGELRLVQDIKTDLADVYGLCMYQQQDKYHVFINDTDGRFQQYLLNSADGSISATLIREFKVASQPEGCVADDKHAQLYFGEEAVGVWQISANPSKSLPRLIAGLSDTVVADIEGMGIYTLSGQRFLVVSSQGNNSYAVYALDNGNKYLGSVRVGMNLQAGIDGSSETDGLAVTSMALGGQFPDGLMVVQDGHNVMPAQPQNFKLVNGSLLRQQIENWLHTAP